MATTGVTFYRSGTGKPQCGHITHDHLTDTYKIFDGTTWRILGVGYKVDDLDGMLGKWLHRQELSDDYLEEQYPELKQLKEEYKIMRDKLKVFEILKQNGVE